MPSITHFHFHVSTIHSSVPTRAAAEGQQLAGRCAWRRQGGQYSLTPAKPGQSPSRASLHVEHMAPWVGERGVTPQDTRTPRGDVLCLPRGSWPGVEWSSTQTPSQVWQKAVGIWSGAEEMCKTWRWSCQALRISFPRPISSGHWAALPTALRSMERSPPSETMGNEHANSSEDRRILVWLLYAEGVKTLEPLSGGDSEEGPNALHPIMLPPVTERLPRTRLYVDPACSPHEVCPQGSQLETQLSPPCNCLPSLLPHILQVTVTVLVMGFVFYLWVSPVSE